MGNNSSSVEEEKESLWEGIHPTERFIGLANLGNTCYANSVLQALYGCTNFRKSLLEYHRQYQPLRKKEKKEQTILSALGETFEKIVSFKEQTGKISAYDFMDVLRQNPMFEGYEQQDAQEFLNYLLNEISSLMKEEKKEFWDPAESSETNSVKSDKTFVEHNFQGTLMNHTKCLRCDNVTTREEQFLDLSVDIDKDVSLSYCLKQFSEADFLRGTDKFRCDICCSRQEASKRMTVHQLPKTAVIHAKRFKFVERIGTFTKLCHRVAFPFEFKFANANKLSDADVPFYLKAVVVHLGREIGVGHYVCLRTIPGTDNWILYDDDVVSILDSEQVKTCFGSQEYRGHVDGYLLLYSREKDVFVEARDPETPRTENELKSGAESGSD